MKNYQHNEIPFREKLAYYLVQIFANLFVFGYIAFVIGVLIWAVTR